MRAMKKRSPGADGEFVGRAAELALLEATWKKHSSAFVPICGRRRVGKSELILHFIQGRLPNVVVHVSQNLMRHR